MHRIRCSEGKDASRERLCGAGLWLAGFAFFGPQEFSQRVVVSALRQVPTPMVSSLVWGRRRGSRRYNESTDSLTQFLTVGSVCGCFSLRLIAIDLR